MTEITLDAMIRRLSRVTEEIFHEEGEIEMCWLVDIPGEGQKLIASPVVVPPGVSAHEIKTRIDDAMRELFERLRVTRYACACECWIGSGDTGDEKWIDEHGSLANCPGGREAICIHAEDRNQIRMALRTIIRPDHGKPYLSKLEIDPADGMSGRFVGLLSGPRLKSTSELPDDEGTVYFTAVPDAPFQILGRRADSGELYIGSIMHPPKGKTMEDMLKDLRDAPAALEILTGPEAQKLIAAVAKSRTVMQ